jgi:4'-phosphopantetheinyl transferase
MEQWNDGIMSISTTEKNISTKKISIAENEIHIWSVNLELPELQTKKLQLYLSTDELQRAQRFYFEKDQNHFIVARGMLTTVRVFF